MILRSSLAKGGVRATFFQKKIYLTHFGEFLRSELSSEEPIKMTSLLGDYEKKVQSVKFTILVGSLDKVFVNEITNLVQRVYKPDYSILNEVKVLVLIKGYVY